MKRIGLTPGQSFDLAKLDPGVVKALEGVPAAAQQLMAWKIPTLARVDNYWSMNTDTMGLWKLLSQARHRHPARARREPARRRDLSNESRR
jgi:hypothetical protein